MAPAQKRATQSDNSRCSLVVRLADFDFGIFHGPFSQRCELNFLLFLFVSKGDEPSVVPSRSAS